MIVGTLAVRLYLPESRSLKDKRKIIQSIKDRLRNQYNISIAEVDAMDHSQQAMLGVAIVCNESKPIRSILGKITNLLRSHPLVQLMDYEIEV